MTETDPAVAAPGVPRHRPTSRRGEAMAALLRTSRLIERRFQLLLGPTALSISQYSVLRILRGAGEAGLPTLSVADQMSDRSPGITRLADGLERRGLLRRVRGSDRRQVLCHITPRGAELLASLDDPAAGIDDAVFSALTHNELAAMVHLLDRVRGTLNSAVGDI